MSDPASPPRPRAATQSLVEPILKEVARSLLEERSALFASSSSSSSSLAVAAAAAPLPQQPGSAAAAAATAATAAEPLPLLLRYPRDPRDADAFTSELTARLLARLAGLGLPCKWAASCSLSARSGGGTAVAAAGIFEEEEGGEEEKEKEEEEEEEEEHAEEREGEGEKKEATTRRPSGGDSLCSVQVEEGGVALTVTAAWVRCV